jgi:hypothetical protein
LYKRREQLINGLVDPEEQELNDLESYEYSAEDKVSSRFYLTDPKNSKEIPFFWLKALRNNVILKQCISKSDEDILKHLIDIRGEKVQGNSYKLTFVFTENEYFVNKELVKLMVIDKGDDQKCIKAVGTDIEWKEKNGSTPRTAMMILSMRNFTSNHRKHSKNRGGNEFL